MDQSDINATLMDTDDYYDYNTTMYERYQKIQAVSTWLIVTIGLVLTPIAIFAVSSLVKKDNVAPINLLVSDLVQLCALIFRKISAVRRIGSCMTLCGLVASVGFMLCIALERYLLIVWPLWYRTRRTVKMSLLLCAVVWTLALVLVFFYYSDDHLNVINTTFCVFLLLPFPLLVFFLVGTFRALSASISVCAEEKRRIVGLLVLVLLIYTLLFLPCIIFILRNNYTDLNFSLATYILNNLNPVADLFLYIFLKKGAANQVWFCLCCCRKNRTSRQSSSGLNDGETEFSQAVLGGSVATSSEATSLTTFLSSVVVASLFSDSNSFSVAKLFFCSSSAVAFTRATFTGSWIS